MKNRFIAMTLTLLLLLSLCVVPTFAEEAAPVRCSVEIEHEKTHENCSYAAATVDGNCPHKCSIETGCYVETLKCELTVHEHTDKKGTCYGQTCGEKEHPQHEATCFTSGTSTEPTCGMELHEHSDDCIGLICKLEEHMHTATACYEYVLDCKHVHTEECATEEQPCGFTHDHTDGKCDLSPKPVTPAKPSSPTYYPDYDEEVTTVAPVEQAEVYYVVCRTLNVRKTPSTKLARIDRIHRFDEVVVVEWVGNWAKIEWNDGYAFVYGKYIEKA